MKKPDEPHRIDFQHDKFGNRISVSYYYKATQPRVNLINNLLETCDHYLDDEDKKMLRRILRTREYSEPDIERLKELRRMYIQDKY